MNRTILLFIIALASVTLAFAGAELFSFQAFAVVDHTRLEWATGHEDNLRNFIIERSADNQVYIVIGQVSAKGSFSHYDYTDSSPLDADMQRTFYYRLRMVDRNGGISYSSVQEVSLSFSAVQQTWGSIKAMFR